METENELGSSQPPKYEFNNDGLIEISVGLFGIVMGIMIQIVIPIDLHWWWKILIVVVCTSVSTFIIGKITSRVSKKVWLRNKEAVEAYWQKAENRYRYSKQIPFKVGLFLFLPFVFFIILLFFGELYFPGRISGSIGMLPTIFIWYLIPAGYWYRTKRYYWLAGGAFILGILVDILIVSERIHEHVVWLYSIGSLMLIVGGIVFYRFLKQTVLAEE